MEKKLIGFSDELIERINAYAEKKKTNFTDAVRSLVELALDVQSSNDPDNVDTETGDPLQEQINSLKEQVEKLSWWTSDDNTSRMGNLEVKVEEMEKKLNTIIAVSKQFKGHIKNREIHLQD